MSDASINKMIKRFDYHGWLTGNNLHHIMNTILKALRMKCNLRILIRIPQGEFIMMRNN